MSVFSFLNEYRYVTDAGGAWGARTETQRRIRKWGSTYRLVQGRHGRWGARLSIILTVLLSLEDGLGLRRSERGEGGGGVQLREQAKMDKNNPPYQTQFIIGIWFSLHQQPSSESRLSDKHYALVLCNAKPFPPAHPYPPWTFYPLFPQDPHV